jgi:4-diphosphocytidyl-2-C-methyl-D-erythritol kinase
MTALLLRAQAKLNLVLRITGRAPNGYHLLDTLFHALDLADDLVVAPTGGGLSLTITAEDARSALSVDDDNLVLRAARAFAQRAGVPADFAFSLHKRIPHGGGLGGGSSDAAAALRLCNALCGHPLDAESLHELARPLGADCAFFLRGGSQWGRGVGDVLSPAEVPHCHFLLVVPPFGCPTAAVYKMYAAHWKSAADEATVMDATAYHQKDSVLCFRFENDLTEAAFRVQPGLRSLQERARELGVPSLHMTGSGSTLFAAGRDPAEIAALAARLAPLERDGVRLLATQSASQQPQPVAVAGGGR